MIGAYDYTYTYNGENQLVRVDLSGVEIARYEYDSKGLRTRKITSTRTERYYYNGDDLVYVTEENNSMQQNKLKYFFTRDTLGRLMHMIDYTPTSPKTYWYILDVDGNVVALADENGNKVVTYEYDAWGNLTNTPEAVTTGNGEYLSNANPFRYSGYQYDSESGLYYLKARYYMAILGRFLTRDSLYEIKNGTISINHYVYGANNPIMNTDPSGHLWNYKQPWNSVNNIGFAIDVAAWAIGIVIGVAGIASSVREILRRNARGIVLQATKSLLLKVGLSAGSLLVSNIVAGLSLFLDFSIGKSIANVWDRFDTKKYNGLCDRLR